MLFVIGSHMLFSLMLFSLCVVLAERLHTRAGGGGAP